MHAEFLDIRCAQDLPLTSHHQDTKDLQAAVQQHDTSVSYNMTPMTEKTYRVHILLE
jgi:hypothetical protein